MKETLIVVVLIIAAITTLAVLGTILPFLDNNVSQHAFAQTNTTSAATDNMTVAESGNITAPIAPQGTSLNATSSQQPTGGAGGGGTSNQTQQQQQQGQADETRSPQQSEAGSGAQGQLPTAQQISGPITAAEGGNVFEGWLVDAGGSEYKLSLGQFRNGTLDFSQYMVNPYTYKNFEVTEEPAEDPDPNAADSVAGFEIQDPFGQ